MEDKLITLDTLKTFKTQLMKTLVNDAPEALDTLGEIAAQLNKDTEGGIVKGILDAIATKVDKDGNKVLSSNDFTNTLLEKLNGIEAGANKYSLPTASASVKGGVKVGSGLSISGDTLAVNLSAAHIPSLDWSKIGSGKPTTLNGYGITDGVNTIVSNPAKSGNAITSLAISGHNLTVTMGKTFLEAKTFNDLFEVKYKTDGSIDYIRAKYGIASDSFLSALGADSSAQGGGGADLFINWSNYNSSTASSLALGANLGYGLKTSIDAAVERIVSLEGGSAMSVSETGSGNAITSITKNGTSIVATKGSSFLTSQYTTHLYVGTSNGNANAATTNGNTYLMVLDNTTVRDRHKIVGSGATTVASDANGNITISSTNTTYGTATQSANGLMSSADKTKLDNYTLATAAEVIALF